MLEIDGSQGEGGGQVLRTSLTLSILTGKAVRLINVRAGRRNPGLAPQHLAGVLAARELCDAVVEGAAIESTQLTFAPRQPASPGSYTFDISQLSGRGSAGAVTLLLQAILLPLALAAQPSTLLLRGGTHVAWSPPVHYLQWVLLPTLVQIGLNASIKHEKWGWYPKGGGEVRVDIQGRAELCGIELTERGELLDLTGLAVASNLPSHIPQRIAGRANNLFKSAGLPPNVEPERTGGPSIGAGIFLGVSYTKARAGFSALGRVGKPSEEVASEAAEALIAYHRQPAALDPHLPDQILPILAVAEGPSILTTQEITRHTLTNINVIQHFIDRSITVEGAEGQPGTVRIESDGA
ncbi:MAG: RNA 3'-phosphate cyclase [Anaerolineae bacterium]|nr:RNA 3'-phosphate cyclase [Anaerolineae bacterium]